LVLAGVAEATAAGRELGAWLRTLTAHNSGGAAPELMVTSPFRRAWQTQLIGLGTAGLGGAKVREGLCAVDGRCFAHELSPLLLL